MGHVSHVSAPASTAEAVVPAVIGRLDEFVRVLNCRPRPFVDTVTCPRRPADRTRRLATDRGGRPMTSSRPPRGTSQLAPTPSATSPAQGQPLERKALGSTVFRFTVAEQPADYTKAYASTGPGWQLLRFSVPDSVQPNRILDVRLFDPALAGLPRSRPGRPSKSTRRARVRSRFRFGSDTCPRASIWPVGPWEGRCRTGSFLKFMTFPSCPRESSDC